MRMPEIELGVDVLRRDHPTRNKHHILLQFSPPDYGEDCLDEGRGHWPEIKSCGYVDVTFADEACSDGKNVLASDIEVPRMTVGVPPITLLESSF